MNHRISAGALVVHDDFWVAPRGGVIGTGTLAQAAEREVREETGLTLDVEALVCVEECHSPATRHCKSAAPLAFGTSG